MMVKVKKHDPMLYDILKHKEAEYMLMTDRIAELIEKMLDDGGGITEVKRNDLAARMGCVPSQINYVITSRFTPERGYVIESRRGGGGYIRIVKVQMTKNDYLMHFYHAVGETIDESEAKAYLMNLVEHGLLSEREARLTFALMSRQAFNSIPLQARDRIRADLMKHLVMTLMLD